MIVLQKRNLPLSTDFFLIKKDPFFFLNAVPYLFSRCLRLSIIYRPYGYMDGENRTPFSKNTNIYAKKDPLFFKIADMRTSHQTLSPRKIEQ